MTRVRPATADDLGEIGRALTRAFHDDPLGIWLMPDDEVRWKRSPASFRVQARNAMEKGGVWTTDDLIGAALWSAPGRWKDTARQVVRQLPSLVALGRNVPRALRVFRRLEQRHPSEAHWYLDVVGIDPDHQGRGAGTALLRPVLDRCDDEGVPAYLVSSNLANVPFYERLGFRPTDELAIPDGPTLYPMWRDPQPDR